MDLNHKPKDLKLECIGITLAGLLRQIAGPQAWSFWFNRSRVGLRIVISKKFPGDADAAPALTLVMSFPVAKIEIINLQDHSFIQHGLSAWLSQELRIYLQETEMWALPSAGLQT